MAQRPTRWAPFSADDAEGEARIGDTLSVRGDLWRLFSPAARFAFLMGLTQPLHVLGGVPDPAARGTREALPHLLPALRDEPLREVARQLDRYYAEHPDERVRPVIDVLVGIYVTPRLELSRGDA